MGQQILHQMCSRLTSQAGDRKIFPSTEAATLPLGEPPLRPSLIENFSSRVESRLLLRSPGFAKI